MSRDPEDGVLTVSWTLEAPEGSKSELDDPTKFVVGFVPDLEGIYKLTLVVNDGKLDSEPVPVYVRATPGVVTENTAPVADAGDDVSYELGEAIELDGSGSVDGEGDTLSFQWSIVSAPEQSEATLMNASMARAELLTDSVGLYEVQLVVHDGELNSAPSRALVNVLKGDSSNSAPVASAELPASLIVGVETTLDASPSVDDDDDPLSYRWALVSWPEGSEPPEILDAMSLVARFTADREGEYGF